MEDGRVITRALEAALNIIVNYEDYYYPDLIRDSFGSLQDSNPESVVNAFLLVGTLGLIFSRFFW